MNREQVETKIKDIVCELMGGDILPSPSDKLSVDLELDSIDLVEMHLCIEEDFGMDFLDSEWEEVVTVEDVIQLILDKDND